MRYARAFTMWIAHRFDNDDWRKIRPRELRFKPSKLLICRHRLPCLVCPVKTNNNAVPVNVHNFQFSSQRFSVNTFFAFFSTTTRIDSVKLHYEFFQICKKFWRSLASKIESFCFFVQQFLWIWCKIHCLLSIADFSCSTLIVKHVLYFIKRHNRANHSHHHRTITFELEPIKTTMC